jgi:hypothetical protein
MPYLGTNPAYSFIVTVFNGGWRNKDGKKEEIIR